MHALTVWLLILASYLAGFATAGLLGMERKG